MIPMWILGHCSKREKDIDNTRTKSALRIIRQQNVLKIMQQIDKNTASYYVFIGHLLLRLYLSMWNFDECDLRFPQKERIENHLHIYSVMLNFPPSLNGHLQTPSPSLL